MGASHFLPQIVGPQQAARLMLTGCVVEGKEAADMGLVLKTLEAVRCSVARAGADAMMCSFYKLTCCGTG